MSLFSKFKGSSPSVDYIIVGLGNPGDMYRRTRHNCGFRAVDCIVSRLPEAPNFRKKFSALTCECRLGGAKVVLLKPLTFMNGSGEAVSAARRFYKLPPERVLVISDDAALPLGRIRVRTGGSDGGQKGLRSIMLHLGTDAVPRIKIGIARPDMEDYDMASYVLGAFDEEEEKTLEKVLPHVADAVEKLAGGASFETLMSEYNGLQL